MDDDVIIVVVLPAGKIVLQVSKGTVQAACQSRQKLNYLYFNTLSKLNLPEPCNLQEMAVAGGRNAFPVGDGLSPAGTRHETCVSFANMKFYLGSVQPFLGKMPPLLV
ncbi:MULTISPECIES: hypothetical protein [unclassified Pseudomonas]|uniref:hypothetical protein n=1 Tax=unclassified Pseudomonas TaxID=196821 RepID=UPI0016137E6F|nr:MULTISPECIES: hypothetical protein [unclassified Pseudomonas]MBB6290241.1 hypothetical protein [Pseudomonas sp. SJZ073]MBB6315288.1 hypothetical protein [Pseudomonas sp. JAI120]